MVQIEVTKDLIRKVAINARLTLTEEELEKFVPQIKEIILDSFNKLDSIDATDTKASFQPVEMSNRFRKDLPGKTLTLDEALQNVSVKLKQDGYIKGPKAL
ncbi:MAG: Asp-tRNA(Asn)/Glu-tRNA(Gln) amidotransferase subunit GatC [archaeon]|jgi:aspartyl/glutamyl-tRNA(Asn/Gln) amidotransferase C subunit